MGKTGMKALAHPLPELTKPVLSVLAVTHLYVYFLVFKFELRMKTPPAPTDKTDTTAPDAKLEDESQGRWRRDITPNSRGPIIPDPIRATIEAIESEARRLGWPAEQLWNANFWDGPRGLAAVLDDGHVIAEVNENFIAILKVERHVLRFQRRVS
jgi:hypothetical protein